MFVKSKMSIPVKYYKGADCIIIKPNTVTYVDEAKVTAQELRNCYGQRIDIISIESVGQIAKEKAVTKETLDKVEPKKDVVLKERTEDLTMKSLNKILDEIDDEMSHCVVSKPTEPTQPTQPTQPTEPTEPTQPTEPTKPVAPKTKATKSNKVASRRGTRRNKKV